jgi:hypothetical protein
MVARNLAIPHKFVCYTDDPKGLRCKTLPLPKGFEGWWNKIYLFKPGLFTGKCLFLDLDVVVTHSLDALAALDGFHIIEDWNVGGFNSSVMLFDPAEDVSRVWTDFEKSMTREFHGDQDVITAMLPESKIFPARWCVSYKTHSRIVPPNGSKIVIFHGRPNPHEMTSPWIRQYWRE